MTIMAAASREGKVLRDVVFSASAAAREAAARYGEERVINAAIGCYAGDDEKLACLPVVEELYRALPMRDFITYAPPLGLDPTVRGLSKRLLKTASARVCRCCGYGRRYRSHSHCYRQLF